MKAILKGNSKEMREFWERDSADYKAGNRAGIEKMRDVLMKNLTQLYMYHEEGPAYLEVPAATPKTIKEIVNQLLTEGEK